MALREILAKFGIEVDSKPLEKGHDKVEGFKEQIEKLGKVLAAGFLINELKEFVGALIEQGSALVDASAQLGIYTGDLQRWSYAAGLSGASAEDLATGFKLLQKNAVAAKDGTAEALDTFKKLGVTFKEADGSIKDTPQLFKEVGIAISKIDDPAVRTAMSLKLLGKGALKLGPMFAEGAEGIDKTLNEFDALGGGLSDDAIKTLDDLGDNSDKLKLSFLSLKSGLVTALFPALNKGVQWAIKMSNGFREWTKGTKLTQSALIVLGVVAVAQFAKMAVAMGPAIKRAALMALPFIIAALAIDDLWVTLRGGDSVTKRVIDNLFGVGATAETIKYLHSEYDSFFAALGNTKLPFDGWFLGASKGIGKFIDKDLPEAFGFLVRDVKRYLASAGEAAWQGAKDIGVWIVKGIVDGLEKAGTDLVDAIKTMGSHPITALKNLFQIGSPSKLMDREIGYRLPEGAAQGVRRGTHLLKAAAKDMGLDTLQTIELASDPGSYGTGYAPSVRSSISNDNRQARSVQVERRGQYYITIENGSGSLAGAVREGIRQADDDDRLSLMADLETVGE